jgi:DNA repair exonuclease SbcCD ATPase subunit
MGFFDFIKRKELSKIEKLDKALFFAEGNIDSYQEKIRELERTISASEDLIKGFQNKYGKIINIDLETEKKQDSFNTFKNQIETQVQELQTNYKKLDNNYKHALSIYTTLRKDISLLIPELRYTSYGLYVPIFNFEDSESYKSEIENVIQQQKELIKNDQAAFCSTAWTVNDSIAKGRIMTKREKQLMIRAFNGECEALIAKVRWNNYNNRLYTD